MPKRAARRPAAPAPSVPAPAVLPGWPALTVLALALGSALAAPPDSNAFWGVNGFRSVGSPAAPLLLLAAALSLAWAARARVPGPAMAVGVALALAGPLHEAGHFLGDTYVRWRVLDVVAAGGELRSFAAVGSQMHAQPLDNLVGAWGPATLGHAGLAPEAVIAFVGAALSLLYFAALLGIARRLAPAAATAPIVALLAAAGSLEVFARYAESGGAVLAFGALWWFTLLRPMARRRDAVFSALAWLALALSHRIALVALVPQLARALVVRFERDEPGPRRELLIATIIAAAIAAVAAVPGAEGALSRDWSELRATLGHLTAPTDLASLLAVVMPLALLAPWVAGAAAMRDLARTPLGVLHAIAFVPLLPLLLLYPMAAHGLGAHRDWELALLPGLIATSGAGALVARLDEPRRRGAVVVLLPLLVVLAGSWLAVNANAVAVQRRAETLVSRPLGVRDEQRAHALVYLGYRASDRGDDAGSARWFDESFAALPNPRNALLAAQSWLRCNRPDAARASIARARSRGRLQDDLDLGARKLEAIAAQEEAGIAPSWTAP